MHRQKLLHLLAEYRRGRRMLPVEGPSLDRMEAFVRRCPDCFERSLLEGHITGSAWILNHAGDAALLTHHKKLGFWLQPGGHADGDADVFGVALREAIEESGIEGIVSVKSEIFDVDVHLIPANPKDGEHYHYDVRFLFAAPQGAKFTVSEESLDLAWVKRDQIGDYNTDESVLRLAEKWSF